jgi:preprotein translocase subunit SecG
MWYVYFVTAIHIVVCFFLIVIVFLQSGKGGDITAAFGGMGSQTAFGPRGSATVLGKATTWAAVIFMLTSITLSIFAARRGRETGSVLQGVQTQQSAPANTPAKTPQK